MYVSAYSRETKESIQYLLHSVSPIDMTSTTALLHTVTSNQAG